MPDPDDRPARPWAVATRAANQLHPAIRRGDDARAIDNYISELRACYPRFQYEVLPGVGFVLRGPEREMTRIPQGIRTAAHRIESIESLHLDPNPQPWVYVHKNKDGPQGFLTRQEIDRAYSEARTQADVDVGDILSTFADMLDGKTKSFKKTPPPTLWDRLGQDDDFGE